MLLRDEVMVPEPCSDPHKHQDYCQRDERMVQVASAVLARP